MIKQFYIFISIFCSVLMNAQDVLTIEDAIKLGLQKNYSVIISKNEKDIAKAQNNIGAAGMSPTVSLNANFNAASLNSYQEFSNGTVQDRNGAQSNNTGASLNFGWVVFDGMRMFAVKKRLNQTEQLSALQLKMQMENTVYEIILGYYDIVRINGLIKASQQNLSIYEEREKLAKIKLDIGSDSKVDLLLTLSDQNKAKSDVLRLQQQLLAAKVNLNNLLSRPVDVDFKTNDSIVLNYEPAYDELKKSLVKNNASILASIQNEMIAEQSIKESKASILPQIQLNASYNFVQSQSQAGFVFLSRQNGLNAGVTAGWLLFNGGRNSKVTKERQIRLLNQKNFTELYKLQIDAVAYINYQNYLTNKQILKFETENLKSSQELLNISMERYKIGKANLLETKETQKNFEDAQVRYINAQYDSKKSETELLRANGALVK
ncbi:MAG: TolC family protein [Sphingobacteriaceae bacterium]|nr:TolC family protein [Sphingobacteriaceae bacterium]